MRRMIVFGILFILAATYSASAQNKLKVAVFDPAISGTVFDKGAGVIIREMTSSTIVNTEKYTIIERSLIDRILSEQKFSNSGAVENSQVSQLGKLAGADKVVLSVISSAGNMGLLSLKMIDVETASVESQKTQLIEHSKIFDIITPLTLALIGEQTDGGAASAASSSETIAESSAPMPKTKDILLIFTGYSYKKNPAAKIYMDGTLIGNGTLNQGFSISFKDNRPGKHKVKIEWDSMIESKVYKINTNKETRYDFEYANTGFGYAFQLQ